jgi:hypothetical protein
MRPQHEGLSVKEQTEITGTHSMAAISIQSLQRNDKYGWDAPEVKKENAISSGILSTPDIQQ